MQVILASRSPRRAALLRHKREGVRIITRHDGKTVEVPADQIVIPPAED